MLRKTDDAHQVGNPDACGETTPPPSRPEQRLVEAYRRYESAYRSARPGTRSAVELACARIDLALLLQASGEALPKTLLEQLARDADSLVQATPPLAASEELP
jgi:hypothetical protein